MSRLLVIILVLVGLGAWLVPVSAAPLLGPLAAPTPLPGAMSVYQITNPNAFPVIFTQEFRDQSGALTFSMTDSLAGNETKVYHVRDISQIPSPWQGGLDITATQPFTGDITDFDYNTYTVKLPIVKNVR